VVNFGINYLFFSSGPKGVNPSLSRGPIHAHSYSISIPNDIAPSFASDHTLQDTIKDTLTDTLKNTLKDTLNNIKSYILTDTLQHTFNDTLQCFTSKVDFAKPPMDGTMLMRTHMNVAAQKNVRCNVYVYLRNHECLNVRVNVCINVCFNVCFIVS
jgi:hypothetical protein